MIHLAREARPALRGAELALIRQLVERARTQGGAARRQLGPNNTRFWFVLAGNSQFQINDARVQLLEFLPKDVTIEAGDTVVWAANSGHTVTFNPTPPPPDHIVPEPQPDGPPLLVRNPQVLAPSNPAGVFDPGQYFNSGPIAPTAPVNAWALTFAAPGTFQYFCAFHRELGMVGSTTVVAR